MCAVSCLKFLCLSWSSLCVCLQSSITKPEILELKMPTGLLFVTLFSSTLPQWATSRFSNYAANWAGFEDFESSPAYQTGKIKGGWWYFHKPSDNHYIIAGGTIPSPGFQFKFWLNSCTLGRGQEWSCREAEEAPSEMHSSLKNLLHLSLWFCKFRAREEAESQWFRLIEFSLAGEEKSHCLQPHNHLAWCVMFIKNRGSHMAGCQQETASLN